MKTKTFLGLGVLLLLTAIPLTATDYPLATSITFAQIGGPDITTGAPGYNTWVTTLQSTNLSNTAFNVWFIWTFAQTGAGIMTWDNTAQQFDGTSPTGQLQTASEANAVFSLPLSDIPGYSSALPQSDSFPVFFVGTLGPGQTVDWDIDQTLSSNIYVFYFGGNLLATPAPEPASLPLLAAGVGFLGVIRRRFQR